MVDTIKIAGANTDKNSDLFERHLFFRLYISNYSLLRGSTSNAKTFGANLQVLGKRPNNYLKDGSLPMIFFFCTLSKLIHGDNVGKSNYAMHIEVLKKIRQLLEKPSDASEPP